MDIKWKKSRCAVSALCFVLGLSLLLSGAALAASLPTLKYGCGLGTVSLMAEDVTEDPMIAHDGLMRVRAVEPNPQRLERLAADEPTRRWWAERVSRCYRVLERIHRG